jgi:hypothetical protein
MPGKRSEQREDAKVLSAAVCRNRKHRKSRIGFLTGMDRMNMMGSKFKPYPVHPVYPCSNSFLGMASK